MLSSLDFGLLLGKRKELNDYFNRCLLSFAIMGMMIKTPFLLLSRCWPRDKHLNYCNVIYHILGAFWGAKNSRSTQKQQLNMTPWRSLFFLALTLCRRLEFRLHCLSGTPHSHQVLPDLPADCASSPPLLALTAWARVIIFSHWDVVAVP